MSPRDTTAPAGAGHTAPFATRIHFERLESDGRFELQLVNDGEVVAYAMVDADLAERLSAETAHMARQCRAAARAALSRATPPSQAPDKSGDNHA